MIPGYGKYKSHWPLLLTASVLPLLLGLLFTFVESRVMVKRNLESTALIALHHAENITEQAWEMVAEIQRLSGQPCNVIGAELQRLGSVFSYFRAIGVTKDTTVYCSSTFRHASPPMDVVIMQPLPSPLPTRWSLSIAGSSSVKSRPGIIFVQMPLHGYGAYAMVDAQYLIDLMLAIGEARGYQLTLTVNNGYPIQVGQPFPAVSGLFPLAEFEIKSDKFPIAVQVTAPIEESIRTWKQTFFTFLPITLILSLFFTFGVWNWQKRKLLFRDEIKKGIANGEFSVYYQPIYDSAENHCLGVEALLRWRRNSGKWIRPDIFIAAAEAENMIIPITRHLFDLVATDIAGWRVSPGFHLGLNVAAEHLQHPTFVSDVRRFEAKVASHQLKITLELTERSLISNGSDVIQRLHQLREEGFLIAIDDFGTGHCSLSYLQNFPLDYLKIDKGFVSAISSLDEDAPILDAIINLSHRMKLKMVAEGVENARQLTYLKQRGVIYMQGFLYARPMDNESLIAWLRYNHDKSLESFMIKDDAQDEK
ncbi:MULTISPECIES: EAL domain-containing protein [unclassified Brenneria]|uniref:EAL domain-containing protein n=1 Tax=unclassified Brenneria TaxID=2634434 RepID=UPI001555BF07|nr:EAL domain-containing protein [Brenneria sp. hezel4-2-4]MEE3652133.1 EAL domain-containing protein [Brenneria sp. HEZEL_4_2_4]NPD02092.1 EAL domain-containing protein [Brenneria sp. hezel4-2-4]